MRQTRFLTGPLLAACLFLAVPTILAVDRDIARSGSRQSSSAMEKLKEAQRKLKERLDKAKAGVDSSTEPASDNVGDQMRQELPDHRELFKVIMAANADVLGDRKDFAWEHHLLFSTAEASSPECRDLGKALGNEFAATRLHEEVMSTFAKALAEARSSPPRRVLRISGPERVGTYNFATGRFPLSGDLLLKQAALTLRIDRQASRPMPCSEGSMGGPAIVLEFKPMLAGMQLQVAGTDRLAELPLDRETAEALVKNRSDPSPGMAGKGYVRLELSVEVDGRLVKSRFGSGTALAGRVVGARALEITTRRELYVFPSSLFAPGTTASTPPPAAAAMAGTAPSSAVGPGAPATSAAKADNVLPATLELHGALPLTAHRGTLLMLRYMPELLSEDVLLGMIKNQIAIEQQARRGMEKQKSMLLRRPEVNKRQPVFAFEWATVAESDRQSADAIVDAFVKEEPDWSFVQRAPGWDDRFQALVDTFVFPSNDAKWEQMDFAARELTTTYRRFLEQGVQRTPTRIWFEVGLPRMAYDFKREALGFVAKGLPGGGRELHDTFALVPPIEPNRREFLPASAAGASVYRFPQIYKLSVRHESQPAGAVSAPSVAEQWRSRTAGSIRAGGAAIVLDRHLSLSGLPMSAAKAEQQLGCTSTAKARIFIDVQGVEGKTAVPKSGGGPYTSAMFKAKVERVLIVDDKGHILADLAPDAFPRK